MKQVKEAKIRYRKYKLNKAGAFKSVFSFDSYPQYIIKTWDFRTDSLVEKEYETSLKYPELYAKIVKINFDKRWMVQEKLDVDRVNKELNELAGELDLPIPTPFHVTNYLEALAVNKKEREKAIEKLKNKAPEKLEMFERWLNFFTKIIRINTKTYLDFNQGNMGYDKEGNLKLLDI